MQGIIIRATLEIVCRLQNCLEIVNFVYNSSLDKIISIISQTLSLYLISIHLTTKKGISQSKKYTKSTSTNQIQLDFTKQVQSQLKIITNWSFQQIRSLCLAFKRYSYQCPYISRFTFKKILPLSDRISNDLFHYWAKGDKFVSFYELVCGLVLTSFNTFKRKLQCKYLFMELVLYLVFNFTHAQSIKLKHYLLMYECMIFAYCRLTDQKFPSFQAVRKFLFQEYLTSESMQVLEGSFQFRRLIEQIDINQVTRELFMRFQCDVLGARQKPATLMLNGLARYNKQQSEQIFKIIKKVYEDKNYEDAQQNEMRKKQRLQTRRQSVLERVEEDKQRYLSQTRDFRIKNRSYSMRKIDGFGSKVMLVDGVGDGSGGKGFGARYSSPQKLKKLGSSKTLLQTVNSHHFTTPSGKKLSPFSTSIQQKTRQLTQRKLSKIHLTPVPHPKPRNVVFLGGKAYTKTDFFATIQYFNSLSNNKDQIKIKQFFRTFQNKAFLKRQLFGLFKYFDKNSNAEISFDEFIKSTYPNIGKKFFEKLREWNIDYKNVYQADKIFIKKENKEAKIQLPEDAKLRINEIFLSFGGKKGYLTYEDVRTVYSTGFSMQECENIVKEFGIDGRVYVEGFARMLLPQGFVIENCDWHVKRTQKPLNATDLSDKSSNS